ncbi:ABC transporter ATP-binding protein [Feifania hominis]|uniref:ABC transporter ATP-binding protein n=1 Tax=Feifania hominis TaxID=2763660 RepID=A0A926DCJ9_9FIRM|nr:ABC transporter ATP-binding protein [Feifania hominis]MBC8535329.1 ABC transporter ATP-binding protein [Feifania hominis]
MNTAVLEMDHVNAFYGDLRIVQDSCLTLTGGITSVIGRNGMGKTTLMKALMGLVRRSGSIRFCGEEIGTLKPYQIAQKGIGYVPQGRRNFPSLTVEEHLSFCARKAPTGGDVWNKERVYELFPRLYERRTLSGTALSGGEQQMLAIGRALVLAPKLLVMDEPSEGLAPAVIDVLVDFFRRIEGKINVLLVEQDLGFCGRVTDQTNVMSLGSIAYTGSLSELLRDPEKSRRLLGVG